MRSQVGEPIFPVSCVLNVLMVLDRSDSVKGGFNKSRNFILDMSQELRIGPDQHRVRHTLILFVFIQRSIVGCTDCLLRQPLSSRGVQVELCEEQRRVCSDRLRLASHRRYNEHREGSASGCRPNGDSQQNHSDDYHGGHGRKKLCGSDRAGESAA